MDVVQKPCTKMGFLFFQGLRECWRANVEMSGAFSEASQPVLRWDITQSELGSCKNAGKDHGNSLCVCVCVFLTCEEQHVRNKDLLRSEDIVVGPHNYNLFEG